MDRRQKNEMMKMERQNERIQNVLRIRTMEVQTAEKKYRDLMTKQSKAQADRARSGRTMITCTTAGCADRPPGHVSGDDNVGTSRSTGTASATVENTVPELTGITVSPSSAKVGEDLAAQLQAQPEATP